MPHLTMAQSIPSRLFVRVSDALWHLGALVCPAVLAAFQMQPTFWEIQARVPGWPSDNVAYVWLIYWLYHALTTGVSPFWDEGFYYPQGYPLVSIEITPSHSLPSIPLTALFGAVASYNIVLLLTFSLTSYLTFLWLRALTGNRAVAFVMGVAAAFFPYRLAHGRGHLPLMSTQWFVLTLFAIEQYAQSPKRRWMMAAVAGIILAALSSWYYLTFAALLFPAYALIRFWGMKVKQLLRDAAGVGLLGLLIVVAFALPYIVAIQSDASERVRDLSTIMRLSISPVEFVAPSRLTWWIQPFVNVIPWYGYHSVVEDVVTPGFTLLALALCGIWFARKRRYLVWSLVVLATLAALFAMGPLLVHPDNSPVLIHVPTGLWHVLESVGVIAILNALLDSPVREIALEQKALPIPLPYVLLYRLPFISSMRAVGRFAVLMNFAVVGLAALGLAAVLARLKSKLGGNSAMLAKSASLFACLLVGCLSVAEYWLSTYPSARLVERSVDRWLVQQPRGAVLELPLDGITQRRSIYARIVHDQPMTLGLGGSFPPQVALERLVIQILEGSDLTRTLCQWQTRYVVLNKYGWVKDEDLATWQQRINALPAFKLRESFSEPRYQAWVYTLECDAASP